MSEKITSTTEQNPTTVENKEKEPRPVLLTKGSVILEITQQCYTRCNWCYQKDWVTPKGHAIPLEVLKKRIEWIKTFTDSKEITLLGGEPLLHPDFKEIIKFLLENGFTISIITSGKISNLEIEQKNFDFVIELYKQAKIDIQLSYQPSNNEDNFFDALTKIKEAIPARKQLIIAATTLLIDQLLAILRSPEQKKIIESKFYPNHDSDSQKKTESWLKKLASLLEAFKENINDKKPDNKKSWLNKLKNFFKTSKENITTEKPENKKLKNDLIDSLENIESTHPLISKLINYLKKFFTVDLDTTVTLDQTVANDRNLFDNIFKFIVERCYQEKIDDVQYIHYETQETIPFRKKMDEIFTRLQAHFRPFEESQLFEFDLNIGDKGIKHYFRIWGQDRIMPASLIDHNASITSNRKVQRAKGTLDNYQICPSMSSQIDEKKQTINSGIVNIRADGEITFATPSCISVRTGMGNVDLHQNVDTIFNQAKQHLEKLVAINIEAKARKAESNMDRCIRDAFYPQTPEAQAKICPSCQCDIACNACHEIYEERKI